VIRKSFRTPTTSSDAGGTPASELVQADDPLLLAGRGGLHPPFWQVTGRVSRPPKAGGLMSGPASKAVSNWSWRCAGARRS
jgi:hypothetical protein